MGPETYIDGIGIWLAAILTICVYSFLIKDNFLFKLTEALFVGVSVGYGIVLSYQNGIRPKIQDPLVRYVHNLSVDKAAVTTTMTNALYSVSAAYETDPTAPFKTNSYLSMLQNTMQRSTMDLTDTNTVATSIINSLAASELDLRNTPALFATTHAFLADYSPVPVKQHFWVLYIFFSLCLGLLYLSRFVPSRAWLSRFPMAYLLGIGVGIGIPLDFQTRILGQIKASIIPLVFMSPEGDIIWVVTLGNIALLIGILTVLYYFFFSLKKTDHFSQGLTKVGIGYLMLGFGASFAFTIMARISLLIGRVEFLKEVWWSSMVWPFIQGLFQ